MRPAWSSARQSSRSDVIISALATDGTQPRTGSIGNPARCAVRSCSTRRPRGRAPPLPVQRRVNAAKLPIEASIYFRGARPGNRDWGRAAPQCGRVRSRDSRNRHRLHRPAARLKTSEPAGLRADPARWASRTSPPRRLATAVAGGSPRSAQTAVGCPRSDRRPIGALSSRSAASKSRRHMFISI